MKQNIKIGDYIRRPYWKEFFEVSFLNDATIELKSNLSGGSYSTYDNDENWIVKEKEQQMKIDMNKKYRRVGTHEPVRVICVDRKVDNDSLPCVGLVLTKPNVEAMVYFDHEGVDQYGQKTIEEVPAVDWSKVKMDTPMWMRTFSSAAWYKRHFNKFENGRVHYWPNGYTSFTCSATSDINSDKPENCSLEEPK